MRPQIAKQFRYALALAFAFSFALLPALLKAAPTAAPAADAAIAGNWNGSLNVGQGQSYRIILHFTQAKDGTISGGLESPDQGAGTLAIDKIEFKDPALHFEITQIGGIYDGSLNKDKSELAGHWKQGGQDFELNMKRAPEPAKSTSSSFGSTQLQ